MNSRADGYTQCASSTPPPSKNYITKEGYLRLRQELLHLIDSERPAVVKVVQWAAGNGDRSENADYQYGKRRLREIDRRVHFLTKRLENAEIFDVAAQTQRDRIFFGARVSLRYCSDNSEVTVRIVGVDEVNPSIGDISWISPVAQAILKRGLGEVVEVRTPEGLHSIEIMTIDYPDAVN